VNVEGIDERALGEQGYGSNFVVFIYEGGDSALENFSWSVDSLLMTNTDLPQVFAWLREHLPVGCCWSLAVVHAPKRPTPASHVDVAWIVGDDVLNTPPEDRDAEQQRIAEEMVARRHRVTLV
jgi:hypothetical protein